MHVSMTIDFSAFGVATGTLNLITSGVTDGAAGSVIADGHVRFSGLAAGIPVTLDNEGLHNLTSVSTFSVGNLTLNNDGALVLGLNAANGVTYSGAADISAEGSITQVGAVDGPSLTLSAVDDAGTGFFDILLNNGANSITGELTATGQDITFTTSAVAGLTVGNIRTNAGADATINNGNDGDLTLISTGGAIVDTGTDSIVAAGTTSLAASSGGAASDITLNNIDHDFGVAVDADGASITLTDSNDIVLGDIGATGTLSVTARAGSITDNGDGAAVLDDIDVAGVTSLSASGNILLDDLYNDFDSDGILGAPADEVDATAANITLRDFDDINLGDIDTPGGLTVVAAGSIVDDGAAASPDGINVDGTTSLTAAVITVDDVANDFERLDAGAGAVTVNDRDNIALGSVAVTGDLSVNAVGAISDIDGETISVTGTTSLLAADAGLTNFFDIALDNGVHDFGNDSVALDLTLGDATTEVDARGANITLTDSDAIKLGAINAAGALSVTARGSITDTDGDAISVTGATSLTAQNVAGTEFFDIRLDGLDGDPVDRPHDFTTVAFLGEDFTIVDLNDITLNGTANSDAAADPTTAGGGSISVDTAGSPTLGVVNAGGAVTITSANELTIGTLTAEGDVTASSVGRFTITKVTSNSGAINFDTGENFAITGADREPLTADGNVILDAPAGTFFDPATGTLGRLADGLTFKSESGLIYFDLDQGFFVQAGGPAAPGLFALTFDGPAAAIRLATGDFLIGSESYLNEARSGTFNPFNSTATVTNENLLLVTNTTTPGSPGNFVLASTGDVRISLQNTSPIQGSQNGAGAVVEGDTFLSGTFEEITLFGTFGGLNGGNAAAGGFQTGGVSLGTPAFAFPAFTPDPAHTANGCVIGAGGVDCTPLGGATPVLEFEDGRLLGIKFVDPTEDEDDPFSNRGDEEEWE